MAYYNYALFLPYYFQRMSLFVLNFFIKNKYFLTEGVLVFSFILLTGCTGGVRVDRYKPFVTNHSDLKELISIDPEFDIEPIEQTANQRYQQVNEKLKESNQRFNKSISTAGRKVGIKVTVKDGRELTKMDADYFRDFAPLKVHILQAGLVQIFGIANKTTQNGIMLTSFQSNDWESSPQLPARFSHLAKKYGTRYFAVHGIRYYKKESPINALTALTAPPIVLADLLDKEYEAFYYSIVADVLDSRIVYREYRKLEMKNNSSDMESILYDSFNMLAK